MKNPIKWLMNKLENRVIKSKEHRVLELAEKLVNELDMFSQPSGVQSIGIWWDYDHEKTRSLTIECNNFEARKVTNQKNKHFKN